MQKPLKVFILAGQSNMQGHAHVRTLKHIGMSVDTAPILEEIQDETGQPKLVKGVWISSLSSGGVKQGQLTTGFGADENKMGPELTFGIYKQKMLDEPILIIKTAWGGKSINTDFRSPSAGPFKFSKTQLEQFKEQGKDVDQIKADKAKATGHYFRVMTDHVKSVLSDIKQVYPDYNSEQGYELAGFVWFQGWNDMVDRGAYPDRDQPGGYDAYTETLAHFVRDVRKELDAPGLPFVVGVMGVGGPTDNYSPDQQRYTSVHQNFRDAMSAVADQDEFKGNVVNVLTERYWDSELTSLKARENNVNQAIKQMRQNDQLKPEEQNAAKTKMMDEEFTKRELETLQSGISNAEYHYLGSSKIMAQIGKGFAEALDDKNSK